MRQLFKKTICNWDRSTYMTALDQLSFKLGISLNLITLNRSSLFMYTTFIIIVEGDNESLKEFSNILNLVNNDGEVK